MTFLVVATFSHHGDGQELMLSEAVERWESSGELSLEISAVSRGTFFRAGLPLSRFESYLVHPGPDYVLVITESGGAKALAAHLLGSVDEENPLSVGDVALNMRQRVSFVAGTETMLTVYVSSDGHVVWGNEVLRPRKKSTWYKRFVHSILYRL